MRALRLNVCKEVRAHPSQRVWHCEPKIAQRLAFLALHLSEPLVYDGEPLRELLIMLI